MNLTHILTAIIGTSVFLTSCTENQKTESSENSPTQSVVKALTSTDIKKISDLKMALMDARLDKVTDLLGQPDDEGKNRLGSLGHYIYYDKVYDGGVVKNLLVCWYENSYEHINYRTIKVVEAIADGKRYDYGKYGSILVQKHQKKVEIDSSKVISLLSELPDPETAVDNKQIKKYNCVGMTGNDIYLWYVKHDYAKLQSNTGAVAILSLNYEDVPDCISLEMTAIATKIVVLKFTQKCDSIKLENVR